MQTLKFKNLFNSSTKYVFGKFNFENITQYVASLDLNFELNRKYSGKDSYKKTESFKENQLVIFGLNWKLIKASDLFSILASFEHHTGGLKKVSILSFTTGRGETNSSKEKFSRSLDNSIKKTISFDRKNKKVFAHVECDSYQTAKSFYKRCNGIEMENGKQILDMRLINLSQFKNGIIIDSSNKIAKNYEPQFLKLDSCLKNKVNFITKEKKDTSKHFLLYKKIKTNRKEKTKRHIDINFYLFPHQKNSKFCGILDPTKKEKVFLGKFIQNKKL